MGGGGKSFAIVKELEVVDEGDVFGGRVKGAIGIGPLAFGAEVFGWVGDYLNLFSFDLVVLWDVLVSFIAIES